MYMSWNASEHVIYWNRKIDEEGIYHYVVFCDEREVYDLFIDGKQNYFAFQIKHKQFLDSLEYYRKTGELPSRYQRGIIHKR